MADDSNTPDNIRPPQGDRPSLRIIGASEAGRLVEEARSLGAAPTEDDLEVDVDPGPEEGSAGIDEASPAVQGLNDVDDNDGDHDDGDHDDGDRDDADRDDGDRDDADDHDVDDHDADDHDVDDHDDVHGGWMDAGDETLGDVLGTGHRTTKASSRDEGEADDREVDGVASGVDEDDEDDEDDVFPDEMYVGVSGVRGTDAERRSGAASERRTVSRTDVEGAAPTRRKPSIAAVANEAGGWSSFAASGPRWRDDAKDWSDVDSEDPSSLGDDETRVGTLNPNRSESSEMFEFADGDPRTKPATQTTPSVPTAPKPAVPVIRIDALKVEDPAMSSAGSQQRPASRRPVDAGPSSAAVAGRPRPRPTHADRPDRADRDERPETSKVAGLGERIVTGLALALVVGFVFYVGKNVGAAMVVGLVVVLAALELANALRKRAFRPAIPVVGLGLVCVVAGGMFRGERGVLVAFVLTIMSTVLWFLFGVERERPTVNIAATLLSFVYPGIAAACAALMLDTTHGTGLLAAAIACTVGHDVVAYFFGRFLGQRKLAPEISPNKTVEGLVGGMIGSIAVGVLLSKFGPVPWGNLTHGIVVGVAVALAAPAGDLVESQLKRDLDIKDMGSILPGHGGVFDRVDGMLLAVPAVWLVAVALRLM